MRKPRILPRGAVVPSESFKKPSCRECKEKEGAFDPTEHVVRFMGTWICSVHLDVKNTKYVPVILPEGIEPTFSQREYIRFGELYLNRQMRRQSGHHHGLS